MDQAPEKTEVVAETGAEAGAAADAHSLEARIIEGISTVFDPEISVNIYELGLIYNIDIGLDGGVHIDMTLTSPACPVAGTLPGEVETRVREVEGVENVTVELVWDPPWTPERLTEAARLELGLM